MSMRINLKLFPIELGNELFGVLEARGLTSR
jgi:hypothetical protein